MHQPVDPFAGQARDGSDLDAAQMRQQAVGLLAQLFQFGAAILDQIPFVEADDECPALAFDEVGDGQILLLQRDGRIEQDDDDFGEAHGAQRVGCGELFELGVDARALPQARRVEQFEAAAFPVRLDGNGVARDASLRSDQQPVLAEYAVEQRRFAGVGAAGHRDAQRLRLVEFAAVLVLAQHHRRALVLNIVGRRREALGQALQHGLVEVGEALVMLGRERHGVAETERIGVVGALDALAAFGLVGDQDDGLVGAAHQRGEVAVDRRDADARVDDEEDRVRLLDGDFGLAVHAGRQIVALAFVETGGVDHREVEIAEAGVALATVAGDARRVVHQRQLLADEAVEQSRLADVGAADDGDAQGHLKLSPARACRSARGPAADRRAGARRRARRRR